MTEKILYGFIAIVIAAVLFFFRTEVGLIISVVQFWQKSFTDRAYNYRDFQNLLKENEILKARPEIASILSEEEKKSVDFKKMPVDIFSNYPFNDHSFIVLNAGLENGLTMGMPIVDKNNIIIGKITAVKKTQSIAQTIFDPNWKSTVAVGPNKIKALFKGGATPSLDLIPLNETISDGDAALNISPELRFGYLVGFTENIGKSEDGSWITSVIRPGMNLETIDKVMVLTDFP